MSKLSQIYDFLIECRVNAELYDDRIDSYVNIGNKNRKRERIQFWMKENGKFKYVKRYQNEQNYQAMPFNSYKRPAQIPIRKSRLVYLLNEYSPKDTDRWIMFNHPNHFTIYDGETKCCIYEVEYMVFETPGVEENPIVAVISQIRINQDPEQHPNDVEDDFDNVSDLIVNGL